MAERIDVLALFDTLIDECVCGDHNCEGCLQLIDGKIAVAELIEAATEARKIIGMAVIGNTLRAHYRDSRAKPSLHALDAALSRCGATP